MEMKQIMGCSAAGNDSESGGNPDARNKSLPVLMGGSTYNERGTPPSSTMMKKNIKPMDTSCHIAENSTPMCKKSYVNPIGTPRVNTNEYKGTKPSRIPNVMGGACRD